MAAKLHEVLAVEKGLQSQAAKINAETIQVFDKKDAHFVGSTTETKYFADEDSHLNVTETKAMVTTVMDKLIYNAGPNIRALDNFLQKEATNQKAVADLVVAGPDGKEVTLAKDVPGVVLLGLETKLTELRKVYDEIPTLQPGPIWELNRDLRSEGGVYTSKHPDITFRGRKNIRPIIMAPATEHHPAQVQAVTEDIPVARITKTHHSSMLTSAQKSDLLERVDKLLRAAKRARQRANGTEVVKRTIGAEIFHYIHDGLVE